MDAKQIQNDYLQMKQYRCDQCLRSFKRKSELSRHNQIHSDERPYICQLCGISYKRQTHLTRHQQNVHKERKIQFRRLQPTDNGTSVQLPNAAGNITKDFVNSNQNVQYYAATTVPDLVSLDVPKTFDQNMFIRELFWNRKIETQTYDTGSTFRMSPLVASNELQSLNIMDQLVHPLLPEKANNTCQDYNRRLEYTSIPMSNYQNDNVDGVVLESTS